MADPCSGPIHAGTVVQPLQSVFEPIAIVRVHWYGQSFDLLLWLDFGYSFYLPPELDLPPERVSPAEAVEMCRGCEALTSHMRVGDESWVWSRCW